MMKNNLLGFTGILMMLAAVMVYSGCEDVADDPENESAREKFLGIWTVEESCVRLDYEVDIFPAEDDESKVLLDNFAFTGPEYEPAYGFVNGNTINLPTQKIGDNWTVQGTGTYQNDGTIFWAYYIEIGANASNCEADYR